MQQLTSLLAGGNEQVELDRAALELASLEYPGLAPEPFLLILDSYAVELASHLAANASALVYIQAANHYLFNELGFRGNAENYYDARNSCLNHVLAERTGIPITLSLIYMEIARRLAKPVFGIGLPGHFLVSYDDGKFSAYIDPFNGGRLLEAKECYALSRQVTGADFSSDPLALAPVSKRYMLVRMLNNLRGIYFTRMADRKALEVLNLLLTAAPDSATEYQQRAIVHLRLHQLAAAKKDLERYLSLAPEAEDRAETEKRLESLRRLLARMN